MGFFLYASHLFQWLPHLSELRLVVALPWGGLCYWEVGEGHHKLCHRQEETNIPHSFLSVSKTSQDLGTGQWNNFDF